MTGIHEVVHEHNIIAPRDGVEHHIHHFLTILG